MKDGGFYFSVGGEDGNVRSRGAEDFMDKVRDGRFSGRSGNADEFHVADWVSVVRREKFCAGALGLYLKRGFFRFFRVLLFHNFMVA